MTSQYIPPKPIPRADNPRPVLPHDPWMHAEQRKRLTTAALVAALLALTGCATPHTLPFWEDGSPGIGAQDVVMNTLFVATMAYTVDAAIDLTEPSRNR